MLYKIMILGLTGPMASGKSTVVATLIKHGYKSTSLSDRVREECKRQGLAEERENLMKIGQYLRTTFGAGVLGKRALEKVMKEGGKNWVIDGIRNPAEVEELRKHPDFVLIANTAPEDLIIERIFSRKRVDDTLDENEIRRKIRREMGEGEPPEGQQVQKCIDMANYVFVNNMPMDEVEEAFMRLYGEIEKEKT